MALIALLNGRAGQILDTNGHASVTLAIFTSGYRLQLSNREATDLVRKQLSDAPSKHTSGTAGGTNESLILSMAEAASRRMEARCCGLARFVPSHGFALVRQMQVVMVLSALWLLQEPWSRAALLLVSLAFGVGLTIMVEPYALRELNRMDVQSSMAVMLHCLVLVTGTWDYLGYAVGALHFVNGGMLFFTIARSVSSKARGVVSGMNAWLKERLPDLGTATPCDGDDELSSSQVVSLDEIGRALLVRLGLSRCRRAAGSAVSQNTASVWGDFASQASEAVSRALESAAEGGHVGGMAAVQESLDAFLDRTTGSASYANAASSRNPPSFFSNGEAHSTNLHATIQLALASARPAPVSFKGSRSTGRSKTRAPSLTQESAGDIFQQVTQQSQLSKYSHRNLFAPDASLRLQSPAGYASSGTGHHASSGHRPSTSLAQAMHFMRDTDISNAKHKHQRVSQQDTFAPRQSTGKRTSAVKARSKARSLGGVSARHPVGRLARGRTFGGGASSDGTAPPLFPIAHEQPVAVMQDSRKRVVVTRVQRAGEVARTQGAGQGRSFMATTRRSGSAPTADEPPAHPMRVAVDRSGSRRRPSAPGGDAPQSAQRLPRKGGVRRPSATIFSR
jgi:hypothetical protein